MFNQLVLLFAGFFAYCSAIFVAHDVFVFADVRAEIDRLIDGASESERHPNADVRKAFRLDQAYLYGNVAFDLFRSEFARRDIDQQRSFHSEKLFATLLWSVQLRIWYADADIYALRLRMICCEAWGLGSIDEIAQVTYSRGLNDLTISELGCLEKFESSPSRFKHRWQSLGCPNFLNIEM